MDHAVFVVAGIAGPAERGCALTAGIEAKEEEIAERLSRPARTVVLRREPASSS